MSNNSSWPSLYVINSLLLLISHMMWVTSFAFSILLCRHKLHFYLIVSLLLHNHHIQPTHFLKVQPLLWSEHVSGARKIVKAPQLLKHPQNSETSIELYAKNIIGFQLKWLLRSNSGHLNVFTEFTRWEIKHKRNFLDRAH